MDLPKSTITGDVVKKPKAKVMILTARSFIAYLSHGSNLLSCLSFNKIKVNQNRNLLSKYLLSNYTAGDKVSMTSSFARSTWTRGV